MTDIEATYMMVQMLQLDIIDIQNEINELKKMIGND
jgi:hypothetical protein